MTLERETRLSVTCGTSRGFIAGYSSWPATVMVGAVGSAVVMFSRVLSEAQLRHGYPGILRRSCTHDF